MNHGENRWVIVYGDYAAIEKAAVDRVYGAVSQYVPYVLTVKTCGGITEDELTGYNLIIIGTCGTNSLIDRLVSGKTVKLPGKPEGYCIKVDDSVFNGDKQMIVIAGDDPCGCYYGSVDFESIYLPKALYSGTHMGPYFLNKPFSDKLTKFERRSAPDVEHRGIWTWGHSIRDYRALIDNMALIKLNAVMVWNDYAPLNAAEFVEYAHRRAVKVIWGYSWGWGDTGLDISDDDCLAGWSEAAVEIYETQYAGLGGDGIYFQLFTETSDRTMNGVVIAEAAVRWVNTISSALLSRHPGLMIQFGLHASSVRDDLEHLRQIDPRVSIIWEDCGAFPFHYIPQNIAGFDETLSFTKTLLALRGDGESFGACLKGWFILNWDRFEHQKGTFIQGHNLSCYDEAAAADKIRRYLQAYWLRNADKAHDMVKYICTQKKSEAVIYACCEDGLFDRKVYYPIAVFAAMLWSSGMDLKDIICETALNPNVGFIS